MMVTCKNTDCQRLYNEFVEFIEQGRPGIYMMNMNPEEYILLIPNFVKRMIERGAEINFMQYNMQGSWKICGFEPKDGYEMKFVLYHPDYLLYKREEMFFSKDIIL